MNLRCSYCSTPFALGMAEKVGALRLMHEKNLHHYDAYCPRCRRANPVSRQRLEMFTPGWQTAVNIPQPTLPGFAASAPKPIEVAPRAKTAPARKKHAPAAKKMTPSKKPAAKAKPAAKPKASAARHKPAGKGAAKKTSAKKKR